MLSAESEEGHTGELCLAPFGESYLPTHYHTYPRPTCKFGWDSGAPELIPPENGDQWAPGGLRPYISPCEVPPTYFFIVLGLFRHYTNGKPGSVPFGTF